MEPEGSCKKRRKLKLQMLDEDDDDGVLLSQGHNCPSRTGPKEPERIANFDQSSASIDARPSSESKPSGSSKSAPPKGGRSRGLIWGKKPEDDGTEFRIKHLLLKGGNNVDSSYLVCHLCKHPYNSELMYIQCDMCMCWYHAEAVELDESKIFQLVGFKCCRCRRIRSPVCPYDETKKDRLLEKTENVTLSETACALNALEHDATEVRNQVKCSSAPKGPLQVPNTAASKPLSEHDATEVRNQVKFSNAPKGPLQVPVAESSSIDSTLIDVEGYCVKKEVAPMLRRIFDKHKDIARDCKIKNRDIIVPILEMICSYCQKLENTTLRTITDCELEDMTVVVENFQPMGIDVKWLIERLEQVSKMKRVKRDYSALRDEKAIKQNKVDILKQQLSAAEAELVTAKVEFDKVHHSFKQQQGYTSELRGIFLNRKSLLDELI